MRKNKLLKSLTGILMFGSLYSVMLLTSLNNKNGTLYDISLCIFGSALLAWLVATIELHHDKKVIQRHVIMNILKIQNEVKIMISEYSKELEYWEAKDFRESADKISDYIREFYIYKNTLKYENGEMCNYFKTEISDVYRDYSRMAHDFRNICKHLDSNERNEALSKYIACDKNSKLITDAVTIILIKEYGKYFADIETIDLL